MNRRDFLKRAGGLLAAIPALVTLKPEAVEVETDPMVEAGKILAQHNRPEPKIIRGKGAILELVDRETGERYTLNADPGISLYDSDWVEPVGYDKLVSWNGAGDSWESNDGVTWTQTGFGPGITIVSDGALYASGDLLEETPEEYRRRLRDYLEQSKKLT